MDDGFYDLHVLPPNPTLEQRAEPLVLENMTKDSTVEFLKRVIARKVRQPGAWREIKLYFVGDEMIDSELIQVYLRYQEFILLTSFCKAKRLNSTIWQT